MTTVKILLLTSENCHFCEMASTMLRRLSGEFPLDVSTLSLASPTGRQLAERNGILFAPGLFVDGQPFSYGRPSERRLRRALVMLSGKEPP